LEKESTGILIIIKGIAMAPTKMLTPDPTEIQKSVALEIHYSIRSPISTTMVTVISE